MKTEQKMKEEKIIKYLIQLIFVLVITLTGIYLIYTHTNGWVAMGVSLLMWSNNMNNSVNKRVTK